MAEVNKKGDTEPSPPVPDNEPSTDMGFIDIPHTLSVRQLAELLDVSVVDVIKQLMKGGVMANINQVIDYDAASLVAANFGYKAQLQAKAQMRSRSAKKVQSRNNLIAQLEKTLYEFEDAARKIRLYDGILIPKAKEMLEASEVAYKAGTIDFLSLTDAQQTLLEFELSYERAVTINLQKLAQLEMLIGEDLGNTVD